jgi:hypothetical protein
VNEVALEWVFFQVLWLFLPILFPPTAPYSSVILSLMLSLLNNQLKNKLYISQRDTEDDPMGVETCLPVSVILLSCVGGLCMTYKTGFLLDDQIY